MKKKLAMRFASLALCVVFTGMLFGVPKSKAVLAETVAVGVGTAVLATCLVSFGLSIKTDSGETLGEGILSMVGDFVEHMAFDTTPEGWLTDVANATTMTSPGFLLYSGAWANNMSNFIEWVLERYGLDEDGDEAPLFNDSTFALLLRDGSYFPLSYIDKSDPVSISIKNKIDLSAFSESKTTGFITANNVYFQYYLKYSSSGTATYVFDFATSSGVSSFSRAVSTIDKYGGESVTLAISPSYDSRLGIFFLDSNDNVVYDFQGATNSYLGGVAEGFESLALVRNPGFSNLAAFADDTSTFAFNTGLSFEALEDFAAAVPQAVVDGTYAPTVELTQSGEGTEEVNPPDDATVVPGVTPWLQSIFNAIKAVGTSIVNGVKGLFVPTDAALESLSTEVDNKLPFIPDLKEFGSDLAYNLEHPEECVDGMGFTTVVDLGKGRGTNLGNSQIDLLDVSWYLEYKLFVDDVIVGFVWLMFLWNLYGELPRIIHGEGSFAKMYGIIEASRKEDIGP